MTGDSSDGGRAELQQRLRRMSKLMFGSFLVLLVFIVAVYTAYPHKEPRLNNWVYLVSVGGMAALAVQWRLLQRRELPMNVLRTIDVIYMVGTGAVFAA